MKVNAWSTLSLLFNQEVPFLQKTFKNLKDSLTKCLGKRRAMTISGAAAAYLSVCKYFEGMHFLHEKTSNLPTHSNVDISPGTYSQMSETSISEDQLESPSPSISIYAVPSFAVVRASSNSALLPATYEKPLLQENPQNSLKGNTSPRKMPLTLISNICRNWTKGW